MEILLFPFGGNAKEAVTVIESINRIKKTWDIIGFIDDNKEMWKAKLVDYRVFG